jgi:ATP-dependent DNA ligase
MTTVIRQYTPMAPTLVRAPFHRAGWVYEEKVDGYRMLTYKDWSPRPSDRPKRR